MATSAGRKRHSAVYDLDVTKQIIENAENRAQLPHTKVKHSKFLRGNNRQYAQALHRQADELCQRGEYESALVLYHRAATLCPNDSSHNVAVRRTAAMISSWDNPEKTSMRLSANMRDDTISRAISCPESASFSGHDVLQSSDLSIIPNILRYIDNSSVNNPVFSSRPPRYLDTHKKSFKSTTTNVATPVALNAPSIRSRTMSKHINSTLRKLKASYNAGKMKSSLRLAEYLLKLSSNLVDPVYKIAAYRYLSLVHVALGRHDRACSNVARMIRLSMSTRDNVFMLRSLVTLGEVHLSFGHLDAAARAWENLSIHVDKQPVLRAWLQHEIGRCHLETGKYVVGLRKAIQCQENAEEARLKKWIFHGGLLKAQCLAMLGRFVEALDELRVSARISEEEGDTPTLSYIRDLIDQLNHAVRGVTFIEDQRSRNGIRRLSSREDHRRSETNKTLTICEIRDFIGEKRSDTLTPSLHYLQDNQDKESNSLDNMVMSFGGKNTKSAYTIESHINSSNANKLDEMRKFHDLELSDYPSYESHMTFEMCHAESSTAFVDEEKIAFPLKSIETRSSNIEMNSTKCGITVPDTFRIL